MWVRARKKKPDGGTQPRYWVAIILSAAGMFITCITMLGDSSLWLFAAGLVGIFASVIMVYVTQYYTDTKYEPVKSIARASLTGPATNIVAGTAVGFATTLPTALVIGISLLVSYWFGEQSGVIGAGAFGTAVATMGMLMTCPYILAMDTFGPITDNANGVNQMAGAGEKIRRITDRLDAVVIPPKRLPRVMPWFLPVWLPSCSSRLTWIGCLS